MERRRLVILTWLVVIFFVTASIVQPQLSTPVPTASLCPYYRVFNESNRARTYNKTSPVLCDTALSGWYRFIGAAGNGMADTCVAYKHCATGAPGWLDGGHPTVYEGTVQRKVCFRGRTKCCSWSININVRNCGGFYVYELKKPPHCNFRYCGNGVSSTPECSNYRFLNESNRAVTYMNKSIGYLCDSKLSGWYRFSGDAGSQMAESCPDMYHCGTDSPGWLSGSHPTVADGVVQRKVCFHSSSLFHSECCLYSSYISVRNCGAFYVYKLRGTRCYLRYCGDALPQAPECFNYTLLNDSNRARTYKNSTVWCTDSALSGWYRFGGEAGIQMANSCVQMNHCGTKSPGWLSGGHPAVADGTVVRKVCFTHRQGCCGGYIYISVRNCDGFYVYNLTSLPCYTRYCAGNGSEPTTAFTTVEPSTPTIKNATIEPTTLEPSTPTNATIEPTTWSSSMLLCLR